MAKATRYAIKIARRKEKEKKIKRTHILMAFSAVVAAIVALSIGWRARSQTTAPGIAAPPQSAPSGNGRLIYTTPNTMRLAGPNVYAAATAITQTTYGATHHEDRPHAITLVRADRQADAMLAASRITHFPLNSPVLYVDADRMPPDAG